MEKNAALLKRVDELTATVMELTQTIKKLPKQISKNSKNSSGPPSSDGLKKRPVNKDRSLRKSSGRKSGAQNGHDGTYLSVLAELDETLLHMYPDCDTCPYYDTCLEKACMKEIRHELDAVFTINATAHEQIVIHDCPLHGGVKEGSFLSDIKATVQYGKTLQTLAVAFNTAGAVSINCTHEMLGHVC